MEIIITNGKIKIDDKEISNVLDYSISSKSNDLREPVVLSISLDITDDNVTIEPTKLNTVEPII